MRVEAITRGAGGVTQVTCRPWLAPANQSEPASHITVHNIDNLELVELNRGKAGSLNIFAGTFIVLFQLSLSCIKYNTS